MFLNLIDKLVKLIKKIIEWLNDIIHEIGLILVAWIRKYDDLFNLCMILILKIILTIFFHIIYYLIYLLLLFIFSFYELISLCTNFKNVKIQQHFKYTKVFMKNLCFIILFKYLSSFYYVSWLLFIFSIWFLINHVYKRKPDDFLDCLLIVDKFFTKFYLKTKANIYTIFKDWDNLKK
jgi:hypothetical protein